MRRLVGSGWTMLGSALVLAAACSSTGEESQSEPVSSAINALESGVDGGASKVLVNEIKVNPPGTDEPNEYVELRGTPGGLLTNVHFVALEGEFDSGEAGEVDYIADLGTACGGNPCALGSNGLLLLGAAAVHTPPVPGTTHVTDATFADDAVFENGSASFVLIYSEFPLEPLSLDGAPVPFDLDVNDDGTLDLPPGAFVIDGIGYGEASADLVYGAELTISGNGPAAATRLSTNTMENSAAAWFYGDIEGNEPTDGVYEGAIGIPIDARLTPGAPNVFGTTPDAGGDAGGGTGGSAGDASVGTGGTAGSAGTGGTGTDAGRDGSAGTGGTGTDAGRDGSAGTGGTGTDAGRDGSAGTGAGGSAGSSGSAGSPGTGGSAGAATAGNGGRAGSAGTAGRDGGRAGSAGTRGGGDDEDDGCSCSTPTASHTPSGLFAMLAALSLLGWRRKRR